MLQGSRTKRPVPDTPNPPQIPAESEWLIAVSISSAVACRLIDLRRAACAAGGPANRSDSAFCRCDVSGCGLPVPAARPAETWSYCVVAALNFTTSSAGIRPRSLTSMPWLLAQSRTSVESGSPALGLRRRDRAGR